MIEYDPTKRKVTLETRGLDMARAKEVFDGTHLTIEDRQKSRRN